MFKAEITALCKTGVVDDGMLFIFYPFMERAREPLAVFITKNKRHQKIVTQDIQCIHAMGSCSEIITRNEKFLVSLSLTEFESKKFLSSLVRVHRSHIVNLIWIDSFDLKHIYLGTTQIPIGASYRSKFLQVIRTL